MSNDKSAIRRFRIFERVEVTRTYEIDAEDRESAIERMHDGNVLPILHVDGDSSNVIIEEM